MLIDPFRETLLDWFISESVWIHLSWYELWVIAQNSIRHPIKDTQCNYLNVLYGNRSVEIQISKPYQNIAISLIIQLRIMIQVFDIGDDDQFEDFCIFEGLDRRPDHRQPASWDRWSWFPHWTSSVHRWDHLRLGGCNGKAGLQKAHRPNGDGWCS